METRAKTDMFFGPTPTISQSRAKHRFAFRKFEPFGVVVGTLLLPSSEEKKPIISSETLRYFIFPRGGDPSWYALSPHFLFCNVA